MALLRTITTTIFIALFAATVISIPFAYVPEVDCEDFEGLSEFDQALCYSFYKQGEVSRRKRNQVATVADVHSSLFTNLMSRCNELSIDLGNLLGFVELFADNTIAGQVIPSASSLVTEVQKSLTSITKIATCTDPQVAANVYAAFGTFVDTQVRVLNKITTSNLLVTNPNLAASLLDVLLNLKTVLETYVTLLFRYISTDLDVGINLKDLLGASLQEAIDACTN